MNERIQNKIAVYTRSATENIILPKSSQAAKRRDKFRAAAMLAGKDEVVVDQEIGDPYSVRRLEEEF
jgi:hypothetical protein